LRLRRDECEEQVNEELVHVWQITECQLSRIRTDIAGPVIAEL